jgi:hypothetical protein
VLIAEDEVNVITQIEREKKKGDVCWKFDVVTSAFLTV